MCKTALRSGCTYLHFLHTRQSYRERHIPALLIFLLLETFPPLQLCLKKKNHRLLSVFADTDFENLQVMQPYSPVTELSCNFNQPFREGSPFWRSSRNKSFWFNPVSMQFLIPERFLLVNSCSSFKVGLIQPSLIPTCHLFCSLSSAPVHHCCHFT